MMYLTFKSKKHQTKTFTKNLLKSNLASVSDITKQVLKRYASSREVSPERPTAYAGELNYFKQGAYNQTNGKNPEKNMVWHTGAETYGGDIAKQYENGSYTEVWFRDSTVGPGTPPQQ